MHQIPSKFIALLLVLAVMGLPCGAMATNNPGLNDPQIDAGAMAADAVVVRPVGIVAIAAGFVLFVVGAPFAALGGNVGDAWNAMVVYPAKFTFARPLGEFE
jgi:hypothetical protein